MTSILARGQTSGAAGALEAGRSPPFALPRRLVALSLPRFLAVGCLGLATDAIVFTVVAGAGAPDAAARACSIAVATLVTWRLNRRFTFTASGRRSGAEAARYAVVALCAQGFNLALFVTLRALAPSLPPLSALVVSSGSAAGFSYAGQCLVTFRTRLVGAAPLSVPVSS